MIIQDWISDIACLFFPATCASCNTQLFIREKAICTKCQLELEPTDHFTSRNNPVEKLFEGRVKISSAGALYYLPQGGVARRLIHALKYKERQDIGIWLGEMLGREMLLSGMSKNIDLIVPVPADKKRMKQRTYNQCDLIAEGVSAVTSLKVAREVIIRHSSATSQTRLGRFERWQNSRQQYQILHPEKIDHKRIILIDDVVTTGATILNCISILEKTKVSEIHVAVIGSPSEN